MRACCRCPWPAAAVPPPLAYSAHSPALPFTSPPITHPACRSDQVDGAGIVLSLESRSCDALAAACDALKALLPAGALISEHRDCTAINTPAAVSPAAPDGVGHAAV